MPISAHYKSRPDEELRGQFFEDYSHFASHGSMTHLNLKELIIKSLNHTLTCNTEGHELAFEVAKKTVNKVSCNLDDYMFMYVTDDFKLAFKHQLTRQYVFIDYV